MAYLELAAFDEAVHAAPAFASATTTSLGMLGLDGFDIEETDVGLVADEAAAWAGQGENEGVQYRVAVIVARSGPYVMTVAVITTGGDDAVTRAEDLMHAVIGAEAGAGTETYDDAGSSTGGVWDKFPDGETDSLKGMEPVEDAIYYPEPEDGF